MSLPSVGWCSHLASTVASNPRGWRTPGCRIRNLATGEVMGGGGMPMDECPPGCRATSCRHETNGPMPRGVKYLVAIGPLVVEVIRLIRELVT